MKLTFSERAWDDYQWWLKQDRKTLARINRLIEDTLRNPDIGLGKPEKLSGNLSGYSSRRITDEHRMVYRADDGGLLVAQLRFHY